VDHNSFRQSLAFSIGYAISRSRDLLRRMVREHAPDDARQQLAERIVRHLEQAGFERPGAQEEAAADSSPDAGRVVPAASAAFSSSFARISFLAAALVAVRPFAASSLGFGRADGIGEALDGRFADHTAEVGIRATAGRRSIAAE